MSLKPASRNAFREHFQPSRICIAGLADPLSGSWNFITLCFTMHTSYKPRMMAFAVQNSNYSYGLVENRGAVSLSVPGPNLLDAAILCGTTSRADVDKAASLNLDFPLPEAPPTISGSIGAICGTITDVVVAGDHKLCVMRVRSFLVDDKSDEPPLLSVGRDSSGFELLQKVGQHRFGIARQGEVLGVNPVPPGRGE